MSEKPRAALVRCESYSNVDKALDTALSLVGGLDFVKPGMRIVIKPNLLTRKHPDAACTTHPSLVRDMCRRLKELGAEVTVGDSPGGPFSAGYLRGVYDTTGMKDAAEGYAALNEDFREAEAFFDGAKLAKKIHVCAFIKEADAVINICKLKTHGMMGYTGAVKNLFGIIPGTAKVEYHYRMPSKEMFADMLVDLEQYVCPRLHIIDAVWGMEGDGPSHGQPRQMNAIIASKDAYAADLVGSALMGLAPKDVFTLRAALERGLCPATLDGVDVVGETVESLAQPDYKKVDVRAGNFANIPRPFQKLVARMLDTYPKLAPAQCVGCGECRRACPPRAITMQENKPRIDRAACIRCFCCQELCPKDAMKIHRPWLLRLVK